MTGRTLLLELRFHSGRYHGGEWPPAPFRLFQALVAGAYGGRWVAEPRDEKDAAFTWLESLPPPMIVAPPSWRASRTTIYVPNNDLDTVGGDPRRIAEIRGSTKSFVPQLFDAGRSILYAWPFDNGSDHAERLVAMADRLHTFGWGIDSAFAVADIAEREAAESRMAAHGGEVSRPGGYDGSLRLSCPTRGSMESLIRRHADGMTRFKSRRIGRASATTFTKALNPRSVEIAYDSLSTWLLYELQTGDGRLSPVALNQTVDLTTAARDRVLAGLKHDLPDRSDDIDLSVGGAGAGGTGDAWRMRFLALPSVGHQEADMAVRRLLVEVPADCPVQPDDVAWVLSGADLSTVDAEGEVIRDRPILGPAGDLAIWQRRVGVGDTARRWTTVTPVMITARRRGPRSSLTRLASEADAASSIRDALRRSGIATEPVSIRVQREPFQRRGRRAEAFATGEFPADRLAHVEIFFAEPIAGPLVLGEGQYLGLGLFVPVHDLQSVFAFGLDHLVERDQRFALVGAFRRAVIARAQQVLGRETLPAFFHGHEPDGAPLRHQGAHEHLFFCFDSSTEPRLLVIAPHRAGHYEPSREERDHLKLLDQSLDGFDTLRAGEAGLFKLKRLTEPDCGDPFIGPALAWRSVTRYRPTRHPKDEDRDNIALTSDIRSECGRRGLPIPDKIEIIRKRPGPKGGLVAEVRLAFSVAVEGPILLGRDAHLGGGVFCRG